jgi:tRNA 2-thiouridine synthesizing protein A
MAEHELNLRRLLCPMPVIKTQSYVKKLKAGDLLRVIATDSGSLQDIPAWCRMYGHDVRQTEVKDNGEVIIEIVIGSGESV